MAISLPSAARATPRLALVVIARDEARCIARCLDSARSWVDEIVVLDTGSVDATPLIAQGCGARVARFDWVDDFAAARNAALALTDAPWRLVVDADEWIVAGAEALRAWCDAAPDHLGQVQVVSAFEDAHGARGEAPSWLSRLLPAGVRYEGRVHEQPASALRRRRTPLVLAHDGYLPARIAAKQGRNRHLLTLALEADPDDAYLRYQLGKDHEVRGEFVDAAHHYELARPAEATAPWRHDWLLRRLFVLKRLGRYAEAVQLADPEMPAFRASPDFFFTLGDVLLGWAADAPAHAAALLPMVESSWLRAIEIGERPDLQDTVAGRGSYLAAHNLAVLYDGLGDRVEARRWRAREAAMRRAPHLASPGPVATRPHAL